MANLDTKLINLLSAIRSEFPDFKAKYKDESRLMRILSHILFFNKGFMTNFITTLGNTIYFPTKGWIKEDQFRAIVVISHEWMHMKDDHKWGILYKFGYLSPQIFAILAILAPISPIFSGFLAFLCPIPSPIRAYFELRAYAIGNAVGWWIYKIEPDWDRISQNFTNSSYFWMFPFKKLVINRLKSDFERAKKNDLTKFEREIFNVLVG